MIQSLGKEYRAHRGDKPHDGEELFSEETAKGITSRLKKKSKTNPQRKQLEEIITDNIQTEDVVEVAVTTMRQKTNAVFLEPKPLGKDFIKGCLEQEVLNSIQTSNELTYDFSIAELSQQVRNYSAGNIANFPEKWKFLTSDKFMIDIVLHGLRIGLNETPLSTYPHNYNRNNSDVENINREVKKLITKGVIVQSVHEEGDVFSTIMFGQY